MAKKKKKPKFEIRNRLDALKILAVGEDSPRSFAAYYEMLNGNLLPDHSREEIELMYEAHEQGKGSLTWAWRGSWKSTVITVDFQSYRIGKEPTLSQLTTSANDASASLVTSAIERIIEFHDVWKVIFPNIVPDKDRGWGKDGYNVKDKSKSYEEWERLNISRIDDTFFGCGIMSSRLIGRHPTGGLWLDDIHDERNSRSDRERQSVVDIVSETIIPMEVRDFETQKLLTWENAIGTPWHEDDGYHYLKNTGEYLIKSIPLMVPAEEEEGVYIDGKHPDGSVYHDIIGWWHITWPERWNPEAIIRLRAKNTKRGFARMYLLDLVAAKEGGFNYQLYPSDAINFNWVTGAGVDYASIRTRLERNTKNRNLFAIAYLAKIPTGGGVIVGGQAGLKTQSEADGIIETSQKSFKNWRGSVVEDDGKGEPFVDSLLLKPHLRIIPMLTRGMPKHERQEKVLEPLLSTGLLRISDADTPFLSLLRKALDDFPDGNDDVRDATYWAVRGFPEIMVVPSTDEVHEEKKEWNIFAEMSNWRG